MKELSGDDIECEEQTPLIHKSCSSRNYEGSESANFCDELAERKESSDWRATAIILGFKCLENAAHCGISANLVVYLREVLHESNASSAANAAIWGGTAFLTPLLAASIADTCLGNYNTILVSFLIHLIGMIVITLSSFTRISVSSMGDRDLVFFLGIYLVAFGSGGIKATTLPFGTDQFNDEDLNDRERKRKFFGSYLSSVTLGNMFASIVLVWMQENISWTVGYGASTICLVLALGDFLLGTPIYRFRVPKGSALKSVLQVLVAAFRKIGATVPTDSSLLYEVNEKMDGGSMIQKLEHTDEFRFLDKAAVFSDPDLKVHNSQNSWRICTVTQVEELKILLRLMPIWFTCMVYAAASFQTKTTFIQQGKTMNTAIGSFSIPPASLTSFQMLWVMIWILIYNRIISSFTIKYFENEVGLSQLQRMGIGQLLIIATMAAAAFLENRRLQSSRSGEKLSLAWQLPQYFIMAASEAFSYVAQHEFFVRQAPETMKSICTAFSMLAIAMGTYFCSFIITVVSVVTVTEGSPGWIPDDLNKGHLDYYYLVMAGICMANFACFVAYARSYTPKKVISGT